MVHENLLATLLNIDRIKEPNPLVSGDYTVLLKNGTELTLSRNYRETLVPAATFWPDCRHAGSHLRLGPGAAGDARCCYFVVNSNEKTLRRFSIPVLSLFE
jgi:hypothetical protein